MGSKTLTHRMLGSEDLDSVVELDRHSGGVSRYGFISNRLASQQRHPDAFISMVAMADDALVGFVFCHIIEGEFGGTERMAVLDAIGVDPNYQAHGVGHQMLDNLITEVRERGGRELRTQASWNQRGLIDFFSSTGFSLAPRLVLECGPDAHTSILKPGNDSDEIGSPAMNQGLQDHTVEIDFSDSSGDDFEALSRDKIPLRSLQAEDINAVLRIDRKITGQDRGEYYRRKFSEVLEESGVRLSLVAELDDQVVGFIMARVDYGEFGRTDTVAVIDNIGIAPFAKGRRVGSALMDQLLTNLRTLRVQSARTEVEWNRFELNRFLERCGFHPSPHLALSQRFD
ncbi:MAG: GNAT family N-acetyltransferase [Gammaproteobacteria bacterium]|nr:GNAT family N-acetyltransferase [Gammaproteobacteria bacterium]